jgi:hypothetical protein
MAILTARQIDLTVTSRLGCVGGNPELHGNRRTNPMTIVTTLMLVRVALQFVVYLAVT